MDIENNNIENIKKKFSFKEYYNNNPEFKARHIAKCLTKITCECGRVHNKSHEALHKRSRIHNSIMNKKYPDRELIKKTI